MTAGNPTARPSSAAPLPVAILVSGRGSNMINIARRAASGELPVRVCAVISDKADAPALAAARDLGIACESLSPKQFGDRQQYDGALAARVADHGAALVVLAGFMRILTPGFIGRFPDRILNVHPSLLPKHRGLHTHRRVLDAGERVHGASIHFVTEELDGGPVIIQATVPVEPADDETSLSARVQRVEHTIYPMAIDWFARGRLALRDHTVWLDGRPLASPVQVTGEHA